MRYLYGDSTAFPINQNFIETAAAATDAAVALLRVDEILSRARKVADDANTAAMKELADLDQLSQRMEQSLAERHSLSNATSKVAEQVLQGLKAQFDRARQGVRAWRDATVRKALQGSGAAAVMEPLHRFVVRHELPYTSWGLRWRAGRANDSVQAQVYAIMQRGLTASVAVAIPPDHLWCEPVRVARLERGLAIKLVGQNWLGHERLMDENLDRYFITRVTRTTERETLVLSKKAQEDASGLRVSLREGDNRRVTVVRVDENDTPIGEVVPLNGQDGEVMRRLWSHVKATIGSLVACRSHLLAATLYGKPVHELETPAPVAVAMIQSVAPLVRDMQRHSRTTGELQLKRDLGDGRREELFISHSEVVRKWSSLAPRNQQLFDMYGLTRTQFEAAATQSPASLAPASVAPASLAPASLGPASVAGALPERTGGDPRELEARRREAVRRAAEAVRQAARQGAALTHTQVPPTQPMPASAPVPLEAQSRNAPEALRALPERTAPPASMMVTATATGTGAGPSFPPPPRVPAELQGVVLPPPTVPPRRRSTTPPPAVTESGQLYQIPAPSVPPRRTTSRPQLRVVNGG